MWHPKKRVALLEKIPWWHTINGVPSLKKSRFGTQKTTALSWRNVECVHKERLSCPPEVSSVAPKERRPWPREGRGWPTRICDPLLQNIRVFTQGRAILSSRKFEGGTQKTASLSSRMSTVAVMKRRLSAREVSWVAPRKQNYCPPEFPRVAFVKRRPCARKMSRVPPSKRRHCAGENSTLAHPKLRPSLREEQRVGLKNRHHSPREELRVSHKIRRPCPREISRVALKVGRLSTRV